MSELGAGSALIVTDKGISCFGSAERAHRLACKARNIRVELFTEVVADPPEDVVMKAVNAAQDSGAECVIGLGGGSSMDVAKLVALLAIGPGKARRHLRCGLCEGTATAADPGADHRRHRIRGHADFDRHDAVGREEGRGLAACCCPTMPCSMPT